MLATALLALARPLGCGNARLPTTWINYAAAHLSHQKLNFAIFGKILEL